MSFFRVLRALFEQRKLTVEPRTVTTVLIHTVDEGELPLSLRCFALLDA